MRPALKAARRVIRMIRDIRRTHEAWSAGETDVMPSNPDALEYFAKNSVTLGGDPLLERLVDDIITEEMEKPEEPTGAHHDAVV